MFKNIIDQASALLDLIVASPSGLLLVVRSWAVALGPSICPQPSLSPRTVRKPHHEPSGLLDVFNIKINSYNVFDGHLVNTR